MSLAAKTSAFIAALLLSALAAQAGLVLELKPADFDAANAKWPIANGTMAGDYFACAPWAGTPKLTMVINAANGQPYKAVDFTANGTILGGPLCPAEIAGSNPRTIEAWCYQPPGVNGDAQAIIDLSRQYGPNDSNFGFGNSMYGHAIQSSPHTVDWTAGNSVRQGRWVHLVASYAGGTDGALNLYVDGALDKATTHTFATEAGGSISIGMMRYGFAGTPHSTDNADGWNQYRGYIGSIRVYDEARTAEQVADDYALGVNYGETIPTRKITASVTGTGGAISPSGETLVGVGGNQTFLIQPWSGYSIASVVSSAGDVTGSLVDINYGGAMTYTFTGVVADDFITVTFAAGTHASTRYEAEDPANTLINAVTPVEFHPNCSGGACVGKSWNGYAVGGFTVNVIKSVAGAYEVTVADGGYADRATYIKVNDTDLLSNPFTPATRNGNNQGTFTFTAPLLAGANTITVYAPLNQWGPHWDYIDVEDVSSVVIHKITASAGDGGTIFPSGDVFVINGASQTFTITPALGYGVADAVLDAGTGSETHLGAGVLTHTFDAVAADHTIDASFVLLPSQTVSGKVTDGVNGIKDATVYFKLSTPAYLSPLFTATTTDAAGNYSISLPQSASWHAAAGKEGYDYSADHAFTVAGGSVTLPDLVLTANANWDVLFSMTVDGLAGLASGDPTGDRAAGYPVGGTMRKINSPTVLPVAVDGVTSLNWEHNVYADVDGYNFVAPDETGVVVNGQYQVPIPCSGATIVAVVQPSNAGVGGEPRGEVVDLFYSELFLAVNHNTLEVIVCWRGYSQHNTGYFIPEAQKTILTLVVQQNGDIKLYANGEEKWSAASGKDYSSLQPLTWSKGIRVGYNGHDGWSAFNGNIGDVYLYKRALPDANRSALESSLGTKFGITVVVPPSEVTLPIPTFVGGKPTFDIPNTDTAKTYTLQYKDDLSVADWTALDGTGTGAGTGTNLQLQDSSTLPGARFYRLSVQ